MKSIKKITAVLCAALCTTMPLVFVACGGDDNGGSNADIAVTSEQITEQQWIAALDEHVFDNVSAEQVLRSTHKTEDITGESYDYTEIETRACKFDISSGGLNVQIDLVYESNDNKKLPDYLKAVRESFLFIKQGDVVKRYTRLDDGKMVLEGDNTYDSDEYDVYLNTVVKSCTVYQGMYKSFNYDKKTGEFSYVAFGSNMSLKFENQKLVQGRLSSGMGNVYVDMVYRFYDYGTTTVEVPSNLPI